jgi:hypothetical protein
VEARRRLLTRGGILSVRSFTMACGRPLCEIGTAVHQHLRHGGGHHRYARHWLAVPHEVPHPLEVGKNFDVALTWPGSGARIVWTTPDDMQHHNFDYRRP